MLYEVITRFRLVAGGHALPELELAACNGCGACVAPCPVQAMSVQVEPRNNFV